MVIVRGVNMFPTQIEEQLLKSEALTGHYHIVLTREGRMDEVAVHVEARPAFYVPDGMDMEEAAVMARVVIEAPGAVERSVGALNYGGQGARGTPASCGSFV